MAIGVVVTQRDLEVLNWLGGSGIASLSQLAERFWAVSRVATARARLARLVAARYLASRWHYSTADPQLLFSLTAEGCGLLPAVVRPRMQVGWPRRAIIAQQLLANDARMYLEREYTHPDGEGRMLDWRGAHELEQEHAREVSLAQRHGLPIPIRQVPDAQVVFEARDILRVVNIEIDGAYYGAMLTDKASQYGHSRAEVWWVCRSEREARISAVTAPYSNIRVLVISRR